MSFKCYNCGDELKQFPERAHVYCCYSWVDSKRIPCSPIGTHYNSWIRLDSENKIKEYAFLYLINDTYYRLEAIENSKTTSIFLRKKVDEPELDFYIPDNNYHYNKYFPITENYIKELPAIFDTLIKLAIFL
jgi:hypothetical protein